MHVDGVLQVDNAQISAAIKDVFGETRSILEPAGAVAVAGAKAYIKRHQLQVRCSHCNANAQVHDTAPHRPHLTHYAAVSSLTYFHTLTLSHQALSFKPCSPAYPSHQSLLPLRARPWWRSPAAPT